MVRRPRPPARGGLAAPRRRLHPRTHCRSSRVAVGADDGVTTSGHRQHEPAVERRTGEEEFMPSSVAATEGRSVARHCGMPRSVDCQGASPGFVRRRPCRQGRAARVSLTVHVPAIVRDELKQSGARHDAACDLRGVVQHALRPRGASPPWNRSAEMSPCRNGDIVTCGDQYRGAREPDDRWWCGGVC